MKLNKKILAPLLSAVLIFIKEAFGYQLPDGSADIATDLLLWTISSAGIFINPRKAKFDDSNNFE